MRAMTWTRCASWAVGNLTRTGTGPGPARALLSSRLGIGLCRLAADFDVVGVTVGVDLTLDSIGVKLSSELTRCKAATFLITCLRTSRLLLMYDPSFN